MRIAGFSLGVWLLAVAPVAAQPPLITLAPPRAPIYGPKTVIPAHVVCTDVPVSAHQPAPLYIMGPYTGEPRELSSRDSIVVLSGGTPQGLMAGQRFYARRLLLPRNGAPVSPRDLGAVHTAGWLTVVAADEHAALARVDYACDAVMAGDYLEPFVEGTLPAEVADPGVKPDFSNLGRVLHGVNRHEAFGAGDFLSIDRGASSGIANGARVGFYRDRGDGTPLVEVGTGIVMEVLAETSKVVVDRARFEVVMGDFVAVRR
ncbi:MAG TPA: hypothetical protein VMO26_13965 [Vicinamibacterales bacterium]|nr:hypothetical protein [Vicinamibacterales bacterium]